MEINKGKIRYILQFFFGKDENASQTAEIEDVFDPDTVTDNYMQFCFRRFLSGIFDVKDAPRAGRPVVKNVDYQLTPISQTYYQLTPCRMVLLAMELPCVISALYDQPIVNIA